MLESENVDAEAYLGVAQPDSTFDESTERVAVHLVHRSSRKRRVFELDKDDRTVALRTKLQAFEPGTPREGVAETCDGQTIVSDR